MLMTMEVLRPIQTVRTYDCSNVPSTPRKRGGEPLYAGSFSAIQIREFPHAHQSLHIRSDDGKYDFALQPDPGQGIRVPENSYTIRTSWEVALLGSWRVSLLVGDMDFFNPYYSNSGQIFPAFRNVSVAAGALAVFRFIPKQSGFIRYIPDQAYPGFTVTCYRFCVSGGQVAAVHTGIALTNAEELSGAVPNTPSLALVGFLTAGVMYQITARNTSAGTLPITLDVSTEKR